jgi:hypothetical protein
VKEDLLHKKHFLKILWSWFWCWFWYVLWCCGGICQCLNKRWRLLHSERNSILRDEATLNQIAKSSAPHWTVLDTLLFTKYRYRQQANCPFCNVAFFENFWDIDCKNNLQRCETDNSRRKIKTSFKKVERKWQKRKNRTTDCM